MHSEHWHHCTQMRSLVERLAHRISTMESKLNLALFDGKLSGRIDDLVAGTIVNCESRHKLHRCSFHRLHLDIDVL